MRLLQPTREDLSEQSDQRAVDQLPALRFPPQEMGWIRRGEERVISSFGEIQGCCGGIETEKTRLNRRGEEDRQIGERRSIGEERRFSPLSLSIGLRVEGK